jgi:hypothetical protein
VTCLLFHSYGPFAPVFAKDLPQAGLVLSETQIHQQLQCWTKWHFFHHLMSHSQGYEILEWSPICGFRVYLFTLGRLIGTMDFRREGWSLGGTLIAHK